ncbi:MAG: ROK family protein [Bacilli bacterium]|jgi:glucokinase
MSQHVISLDIGGTNMRAAIIDDNLTIVRVIREPTLTGSVELFLEQVVKIIKALKYEEFAIKNIAIAIPGRVRHDGYIYEIPNIGIEKIPLRDHLLRHFPFPIFVRNDAELAGLAEAIHGVGKGLSSTFFVTISTGLGGAYIENGAIKQLDDEIGHHMFYYQGKLRELEKIASGNGIINLCSLNGVIILHPSEFFSRVRAGDSKFLAIYQDWLELLGGFFAHIEKVFTPKVVALTGGVMRSEDVFLEDLRKRHPNLVLKRAQHLHDAGLIGTACFGFQQESTAIFQNVI